MTIEILPMERARKFAIAYLSSIEGHLNPEDHATQHFALAMAAARREGAELRALDEVVIEAAREMVEAHDAIRTDTASS